MQYVQRKLQRSVTEIRRSWRGRSNVSVTAGIVTTVGFAGRSADRVAGGVPRFITEILARRPGFAAAVLDRGHRAANPRTVLPNGGTTGAIRWYL
jgi:hypothetical protein